MQKALSAWGTLVEALRLCGFAALRHGRREALTGKCLASRRRAWGRGRGRGRTGALELELERELELELGRSVECLCRGGWCKRLLQAAGQGSKLWCC